MTFRLLDFFTAGAVLNLVLPQLLGTLFFVVITIGIKMVYYICEGSENQGMMRGGLPEV